MAKWKKVETELPEIQGLFLHGVFCHADHDEPELWVVVCEDGDGYCMTDVEAWEELANSNIEYSEWGSRCGSPWWLAEKEVSELAHYLVEQGVTPRCGGSCDSDLGLILHGCGRSF